MKLLQRFRPAPRFASYAEARQSCEGYEHPDLVRLIHEKTKRYRDSLNGDSSFPFLHGPNVLDFGGACGAHYFKARSLRDLRWHVVETPAMAREAKDMEDGKLRFFDTLASAKAELGTVNFLFTSGALQYVPDPYATLAELVNCGAERMFITRLPLCEEEIISVQTSALRDNGPGPLPPGFTNANIRYPVTFLQREKFESILRSRYEIKEVIVEERKAYWTSRWIPMYGYSATKS